MVLFNYSTRELTAKVVYYGPGLCGKTTNLQYIYDNLPAGVKGKMLSLATKTDRTLFFDFLPIDLGEIRGMKTRIQLYTVPGQVFYNETRRLVLKGADGVVFVADSQKQMTEANLDSFRNLDENLKAHGMKLSDLPLVIQFNKRDLPSVSSIEELNSSLNRYNSPFYESIATTGIGVQDTLKAITKLVLLHLTRKYDVRRQATSSREPAPPLPRTAPSGAPTAGASTVRTAEGGARPQPSPPAGPRPTAGGVFARTSNPLPGLSPALDRSAESPTGMLRAVPVASGGLKNEEVVDLVDVVEPVARPISSLREVTDEAELIQREEDREVEILEDSETDNGDGPGFQMDTSTILLPSPGRAPAPASSSSAAAARSGELAGAKKTSPPQGQAVPIPVRVEARATSGGPSVQITEVKEDDEMFLEGSEVARVDGRQPVEVIVPIELSAAGRIRRFRLALRLSVSEIGPSS